MKINFNKLNNKPVPLPWYKKLFKSQLGLALGETRSKKRFALFGEKKEKSQVGETKSVGNKTYELKEGTPSKPRWHKMGKEDKDEKKKLPSKIPYKGEWTEKATIEEMEKLSMKYPGKYVVFQSVYDEYWFSVHHRLTKYLVPLTKLGGYAHNGKFKEFSKDLVISWKNTGLLTQ